VKKLYILFTLIIIIPITCWAGFKPIRVIAPELSGVKCLTKLICVEDETQLAKVKQLYSKAMKQLESDIDNIQNKPRVVFCSTEKCFNYFGLYKEKAVTVATFGIVMSPRAWKHEYLVHELIHHLQHERLGFTKVWFSTPHWFMEGMAYSLSNHPDKNLKEPWKGYRNKFDTWYATINKSEKWLSAKNL